MDHLVVISSSNPRLCCYQCCYIFDLCYHAWCSTSPPSPAMFVVYSPFYRLPPPTTTPVLFVSRTRVRRSSCLISCSPLRCCAPEYTFSGERSTKHVVALLSPTDIAIKCLTKLIQTLICVSRTCCWRVDSIHASTTLPESK